MSDAEHTARLLRVPKVSAAELARHDGTDATLPLWLAIAGEVYDVSSASRFYSMGSPYNVFAGHEYTRALALGSLDDEDMTSDVSSFTEVEMEALRERMLFYRSKYELVARLEDPPP